MVFMFFFLVAQIWGSPLSNSVQNKTNNNTMPGSLIFIAFSPPPVVAVVALDLTTHKTRTVAVLGNDLGSMYTQSSAKSTVLHKDRYITNLQEKGSSGNWVASSDCKDAGFACTTGTACCKDPHAKGGGNGACYKVSECSQIKDPAPQHGVTIGVDIKAGKAQILFRSFVTLCFQRERGLPVQHEHLLVHCGGSG